MALAKDLMQVGVAAEAAVRVGFQVGVPIVAAGTTNADAAVLPQAATLVQVSGAAAAGVKLPANAELGVPYVLANTTTNAILVYPPTGGNLNGDVTTTGTVSFASRGTIMAIRINNTDWCAVIGAAG